jgi:hypothetical protein
MGTIVQRKRGDGTIGYMAQVRVKQKGKVVHAETKTFDRKQAASAWVARRETELREPGALERIKAVDPTLGEVIDRYVDESKRKIGRTKTQVLRTIKTFDIADMKCSTITSADIVSFAQALKVAPQTVGNYLSHLAAIFAVARPAWGYPLDQQVMKDAFVVAKKMGLTAKGRQRERTSASSVRAVQVHCRCRRLSRSRCFRRGGRRKSFASDGRTLTAAASWCGI